jgi:hypothetical protein
MLFCVGNTEDGGLRETKKLPDRELCVTSGLSSFRLRRKDVGINTKQLKCWRSRNLNLVTA